MSQFRGQYGLHKTSTMECVKISPVDHTHMYKYTLVCLFTSFNLLFFIWIIWHINTLNTSTADTFGNHFIKPGGGKNGIMSSNGNM